jgi:hypothetical protein
MSDNSFRFHEVCTSRAGATGCKLIVQSMTVNVALRAAWERWTWVVLLSPSGAFCWGVISFSVTFPLFGMMMIFGLVAEHQQRHRWGWVILLIVVILLLPFVTDTLIWGSFPLTFDNSGVARLRMIPFIPWPSGGYDAI